MRKVRAKKIDTVRVLQKVADGFPLIHVAEEIGVRYESLKNHMFHYYNAVGADTLPHAVAKAFRAGLIR